MMRTILLTIAVLWSCSTTALAEPTLLDKPAAAVLLSKEKVLLKMGYPLIPVLLTPSDVTNLSTLDSTVVHQLMTSRPSISASHTSVKWALSEINGLPCLQSSAGILLLLTKPADKWKGRTFAISVSEHMLLLTDTKSDDVFSGIQLP